MTNSAIKNAYGNSITYINSKEKYSGLVFELNFFGDIKYL
jgi:hypothetical protein